MKKKNVAIMNEIYTYQRSRELINENLDREDQEKANATMEQNFVNTQFYDKIKALLTY